MTLYITPEYGLSDESLAESYIECRDPKHESYLTREQGEDAYVSIADVIAMEQREDALLRYDLESDVVTPGTSSVTLDGESFTVTSLDNVYKKQDVTSNFFVDKDGWSRIGSVRFREYNGSHIANCVKCGVTITYAGEYDRASMEEFTLAVYRHGHNHSAYFVTKTPIGVPVAQEITPDMAHKYNVALFVQEYGDVLDRLGLVAS